LGEITDTSLTPFYVPYAEIVPDALSSRTAKTNTQADHVPVHTHFERDGDLAKGLSFPPQRIRRIEIWWNRA